MVAFYLFWSAKSALPEIPLLNVLGENRQFSLPKMCTLCPFNSAVARYFPSIFAHMHVCDIHYQ